MELCDDNRVLVWEAQRNLYRGKHLAQTGIVKAKKSLLSCIGSIFC